MGKKKRKSKQEEPKKQELLPAAPTRLNQMVSKREFKAGKSNRLTASWGTVGYSLDQDIHQYLEPIRARSRNLYNNNEYAKRFITRLKGKCIGAKGIGLQVMALRRNGRLDEADSRMVEMHYRAWSRRGEYDVTGKLSRANGENLMLHHMAQDGEVLIRIIKNYGTRYRYALQFLDPERLDIRLNRFEPNGNRISMGVEKDAYNKPVAYWILKNHPYPYLTNYNQGVGNAHERIPADQIIHEFLPIRAEQSRGIPWMHAVMISLNDVGGYREAAIVASRVGASKMGFIKTPSGEGFTGQTEDEEGNQMVEVEPGTFGNLSNNEELIEWNPNYPHEQFDMFNKAVLKGIAAGLETSYHAMAGDLEGVNYSSARAGDRDELDTLTAVQQMIVDINQRIYEDWLQYQLDIGGIEAPPTSYDKLNAAIWVPKRWQEIDPQKTADANKTNLEMGIVSEISIISEQQGKDPEQVVAEKVRWRELHRAANIPLNGAAEQTIVEETAKNELEETTAEAVEG